MTFTIRDWFWITLIVGMLLWTGAWVMYVEARCLG